jgi:hypothetical protein
VQALPTAVVAETEGRATAPSPASSDDELAVAVE